MSEWVSEVDKGTECMCHTHNASVKQSVKYFNRADTAYNTIKNSYS